MFDAGYDPDGLTGTILSTTVPDSWEEVGGPGGIVLLGDVLFVRQTNRAHREVQGLLTALRKHGRRTLVLDPAEHQALRVALGKPVTVAFRDTPLAAVAEQLANLAEADIRIDRRALSEGGIRDRLPISLELDGQSLSVTLKLLLEPHELTWQLKDGVLWITTIEAVEMNAKTAVFDVRDLCRNMEESDALADAVQGQSHPETWEQVGGVGAIEFPVPGAMVVQQTERCLDDVATLLENYRTALRASKPRVRADSDPKAVITRYYRMPTEVADGLLVALPDLLRPETWKSEKSPKAEGTILKLASWGEVKSAAAAAPASDAKGSVPTTAWMVPHSVLVIRQMREVHNKIPAILQRIEHGEQTYGGFGMGGGMGGGFGGGFFSVK